MKYGLVAVLDCSDEELSEQLQIEAGLNPVNDYAKWLISVAGREPELMNEMMPYDEIIDESRDFILTYSDCNGLGENVYLYLKLDGYTFNFNYNAGVRPNYCVEYSKKGGPSVSNPAIFNDDEQAIVEAVNESHDWAKIGMTDISVLKYGKSGLTEIWRNK